MSGLMKDGLGNWAEAAAHIGTRTKEDCERHYLEVYLGVGPDGKDLLEDSGSNGHYDHEKEKTAGSSSRSSEPPRKRQRREFMPVSPGSRPLVRTRITAEEFASQWTWTSRSTMMRSRRKSE